jgi:hypothetical protein
MTSAFIHKPKEMTAFVHPVHTKVLWHAVWDEARKQDWHSDDLTLVGGHDGYFYFQKSGVTTGYARLQVEGGAS